VLLSLSSISILPEADSAAAQAGVHARSVQAIARFTPTRPFVVRADAPWKTLAEFIADAKPARRAELRQLGQLRHDACADGC